MRKKLAEEFTSGQFLVLTGLDEEVKRLSRKILTSMLKSLLDTLQLHGYGKRQVQGVWKLCDILNRWIWVTDVKTGFCEGDCYIIVYFKKRTGLHNSYQQAKQERSLQMQPARPPQGASRRAKAATRRSFYQNPFFP